MATVLVVEDNFYNVVPLRLILKNSAGISIDRAENGKIGVDMYAANATKKCCKTYYRLVLMDINMPVMDGCQATKEILHMHKKLVTKPQYAHLLKPIIYAMTAM